MNRNYKLLISLLLVTMLGLTTVSYKIAWSDSDRDKDYCYDEVGDGHFCFYSKHHCRHNEKQDEIAESPCYNKDRVNP